MRALPTCSSRPSLSSTSRGPAACLWCWLWQRGRPGTAMFRGPMVCQEATPWCCAMAGSISTCRHPLRATTPSSGTPASRKSTAWSWTAPGAHFTQASCANGCAPSAQSWPRGSMSATWKRSIARCRRFGRASSNNRVRSWVASRRITPSQIDGRQKTEGRHRWALVLHCCWGSPLPEEAESSSSGERSVLPRQPASRLASSLQRSPRSQPPARSWPSPSTRRSTEHPRSPSETRSEATSST